jgi:hypothetical protein
MRDRFEFLTKHPPREKKYFFKISLFFTRARKRDRRHVAPLFFMTPALLYTYLANKYYLDYSLERTVYTLYYTILDYTTNISFTIYLISILYFNIFLPSSSQYCIHIYNHLLSLLYHITVPLHLCTSAPLHLCTTAPLHHCTTAPLHHCTTAPLHHCTTAPLHHSIIKII